MSQVSKRRKRQLAFAALGAVLLCCLLGANLAVGAERTVTDQTYVTDRLAQGGVYEAMATDMAAQMTSENGTDVSLAIGENTEEPPFEDMIEEVVTPAYVREEVERNVGTVYAYLHGDRQDAPLAFDLTPVKAGLAEEMEAWTMDLAVEAIDPTMARLAANESAFRSTRDSFTQDQLERIQRRTGEDHSMAELQAIYDDNRDRVRERLLSELDARVGDGTPEPVRPAAETYGTVGVDALVSKNASYRTFLEREAATREDLAAAVGEATRERLDEQVVDRMDLTNGTNGSVAASLGPVRTGFSALPVLLALFPLGALAAAGGIGSLSRRRSDGFRRVGGIVVAAGAVGFLATVLLSRLLPAFLQADPENPSAMGVALLAIGRDATATIGTQSLVLVALGLALLAVGVAIRRDLLPVSDHPGDAANATESEAAESNGDGADPGDGEGDGSSAGDGFTDGDERDA